MHVFEPANIEHLFAGALDHLGALVKDRAGMRANGTWRHICSGSAKLIDRLYAQEKQRVRRRRRKKVRIRE
jgi:hypothetical protein